MSSLLANQVDLKQPSSPTMQPLPSEQKSQPTIYVQQQHPIGMTNPMLLPQGTGTTQAFYPPQAAQPIIKPVQPYSSPQLNGQLYPQTMQPNPTIIQNPIIMQQPQYIQPLVPAQTVYVGCANGEHQWNTVYGTVGVITAIICFPIGLLALLVDKKNVCVRCQTSVPA